MTEEKSFRVTDKRAAASTSASTGEGFTMKEPAGNEKPVPAGQVDFSTLVLSLATGALINLGAAPDPATGKSAKNIEMARQNIDILGLLREKTRGNLSEEEKNLLENLLAETKLRFVEASK